MFDVSSLPRDPEIAFVEVLRIISSRAQPIKKNTVVTTHQKLEFTTLLNVLSAIALRLDDAAVLHENISAMRHTVDGSQANGISVRCLALEQFMISRKLEDHFLGTEEVDEFENVHWEQSDRDILFETLSEARKFTQRSDSFDDRQTRKILHYLSKVENEVLKPIGNFTSVLGSAHQLLDLVEAAGKKAQPLAKMVETMRTTTKRNVSEYSKLEAPDEQKKLPKPDEAAE